MVRRMWSGRREPYAAAAAVPSVVQGQLTCARQDHCSDDKSQCITDRSIDRGLQGSCEFCGLDLLLCSQWQECRECGEQEQIELSYKHIAIDRQHSRLLQQAQDN